MLARDQNVIVLNLDGGIGKTQDPSQTLYGNFPKKVMRFTIYSPNIHESFT